MKQKLFRISENQEKLLRGIQQHEIRTRDGHVSETEVFRIMLQNEAKRRGLK